MKYRILALILKVVSASRTANENYSTDEWGCNRFARQFPNTCQYPDTFDAKNQMDFDQVPVLEDKRCRDIDLPKCKGRMMEGWCRLRRKLCVMCFKETRDGRQVVRLRVQTNTIPNHCYQSEQAWHVNERKVDFTVDWLPPAVENGRSTPGEQLALNKLICDRKAAKDHYIPKVSNYQNNGGDDMSTIWGVSMSGAVFTTAVTPDKVDPFFPAPYTKGIKSAHLLRKTVDWCLSSANLDKIFHYKVPSTCLVNSGIYETRPLP